VDEEAGLPVSAAQVRMSERTSETGRVAGLRAGIEGAAGLIVLDRPDALNALTLAMREAVGLCLTRWARDPQVYAVVMRSTSARVFCAGGDVRELIARARESRALAEAVAATEYTLNWQLDCFSKPIVALIDGLVMGGGVGLTAFGTHRVAGPGYRFAMPETAIGFFPDDGVAYLFARMPHEIGMYLALTGRQVARADAFRLGLVTHCIAPEAFAGIERLLMDAEPVDPLLDARHEDPGPGSLDEISPLIERCFGGGSVEDIVASLRAETGAGAAWARSVLDDLAARSPTSLKVTYRCVRAARSWDLRRTLLNNYRMAVRMLAGHDVHEGVRARLEDRDGAPRWSPARLEDVSDAVVDAYFAPIEPPETELGLRTRAEMQTLRG
jgi:enoyl-CoA hydratase